MPDVITAPPHYAEGLAEGKPYSLYALAISHAATHVRTFDFEDYGTLLLWPRGGEAPMADQDYWMDIRNGEAISLAHEATIARVLASGRSIALVCHDYTYEGAVCYGAHVAMRLCLQLPERLALEGLTMAAAP